MAERPSKVKAQEIPARQRPSNYPEPFASRMEGRIKRALGDFFGLKNFGVNLTTLTPQARSALFHEHSLQEEFIYILKGHPTLVTEAGESIMEPGDVAGFIPGGGAHMLVNLSNEEVVYIEIGDRPQGDQVSYPKDDLMAAKDPKGRWQFLHKDGRPYNKEPK